MMTTKSTLKVPVGTVKKSHATRSWTWFVRKAFHVGEDGLRTFGRYFSTVDFATYHATGGYKLLGDCLSGKRTREDVIKGVDDAGLRGLGGAGFPTGRKWTLVRKEAAPRLMAVNGDEGEPGTFKDRHYLGLDPHRFIEGMLLAAWVVEAPDIYVYIRDEYPELIMMLEAEFARVSAAGLTPHARIHLRRGAGAARAALAFPTLLLETLVQAAAIFRVALARARRDK